MFLSVILGLAAVIEELLELVFIPVKKSKKTRLYSILFTVVFCCFGANFFFRHIKGHTSSLSERLQNMHFVISYVAIVVLLVSVLFMVKYHRSQGEKLSLKCRTMWNTLCEKNILKRVAVSLLLVEMTLAAVAFARINRVLEEAFTLEEPTITENQVLLPLQKGSYAVTIQYSTEFSNIEYQFHSKEEEHTGKLEALSYSDIRGYFSPYNKEQVCNIILKDDLNDLIFRVGDAQRVKIAAITVARNAELEFLQTVQLLAVIIGIDLLYVFRKKLAASFRGENKKYILAIIGVTLLAGIPCASKTLFGAHDLSFHLTRIEGIREALLCGQFPVQIHPVHMMGYGYATGTFYPELFLYIPAFFRILGFSIPTSYKVFVMLVHLTTVSIAFFSFRRMLKQSWTALLGAALYTLAPYRLIDVYYRGAVGEYCALIFLPLIAYALYTFIAKEEKADWKALFLGFTGVLQSHILSVVFVAIFCVITGCLFVKCFKKRENIIVLLKTFTATIMVNLFFLVPFLDFYRLERYDEIKTIQQNGTTLLQMFVNKIRLAEVLHNDEFLKMAIEEDFPKNISFILLLLCVVYLFIRKRIKEKRKMGDFSLFLGVLSLFFTWKVFPWDSLLTVPKLNTIITSFQFPWRFLGFANLFLTITAGMTASYIVERFSRTKILIFLSILTIYGGLTITDYIVFYSEAFPMDLYSVDTNQIGSNAEYLIRGTDVSALREKGSKIDVLPSDGIFIMDYEKQGTNLGFKIINDAEIPVTVDLPVLYYPGYRAKAGNQELEVRCGENNRLRINIPNKTEGTIRVWYSGSWFYKMANLISVIAALGLCVDKIRRQERNG